MRKVKIIAMLIAAFFLLSAFITAEAEQADFMQEGEKILSDNERLASGLSVSAGDSSSQEDIQSGNTYYDKLIAQELKERQYAIYTNQLKAQLVDYQITYLTTWEAELSEKYKIEKAKLDLGYTTSIAVDVAHNQYTVAGHQIQTAMAQQELYKEVIVLNGGEYKEISFTEDLEPLNGNYFKTFEDNSTQLISYRYQILIAGNTKSAELLQLQKEQYEINLHIYVQSLQMKYEEVLRQITLIDNELAVAEEQMEQARTLYEKGKIAEIQVKELQTELSRLEYERMGLICDAKRIYYILTHTIEGQEIA